LGQWLLRAEEQAEKPPLFWEVAKLHPQLHILAKEILSTSQQSHDPSTLKAMVQFRELWKNLHLLLDEMKSLD
jgi:hypothetical protein